MLKRNIKKTLVFLMTLIFSIPIYAKPNVNILTWWGYLNAPWETKLIESTCHVNLSYDEYYSTDEFLRRWYQGKKNYDIAIFEDTTYPLIAKQIPHIKSNLCINTNQYNPIIRKKYKARHYPNNIVFFYQSVTGFLWNPKIISLASQDSLLTIFKKAKTNLVVLIDDPIVFQKLQHLEIGSQKLSLKEFLKIKQKSKIFIANSYDKLYRKSDFAFSYTWSGTALSDLIHANTKFLFLVNPKVSYISSDLLAQLNNNPGVSCVANVLASKKFLTKFQTDTYYFSPYTDYSNIKNNTFKKVYKQYVNTLQKLHWIKPVDEKKMESLERTWKKINLYLDEKDL